MKYPPIVISVHRLQSSVQEKHLVLHCAGHFFDLFLKTDWMLAERREEIASATVCKLAESDLETAAL